MWVIYNFILNFIIIFGYLFGIEGCFWLVGVNFLEDVVGGYIWIGVICILGGFWYMRIVLFNWVKKILVWLGEVYLFYSIGVVSLMVFVVILFVFVNFLVFFIEFYGLILILVFDCFFVFVSFDGVLIVRVWLVNVYFWLGFFFL